MPWRYTPTITPMPTIMTMTMTMTMNTIAGRGRRMVDDFIWRALVCGAAIALVAGPLGSFLVWRRMAYFGDALSHTALLGIALGLAVGVAPSALVIAVCAAAAIALSLMERRRWLAPDTLLGIVAHGALSFGMIAMSLLPAGSLDLYAYLFGDILSVGDDRLALIAAGAAGALAFLALIWRPLLAITVHEELAAVEGVKVAWVRTAYLLLIALSIALAMQVVGVLLVTSLMIVPAAAARAWARSPEAMAAGAAGLGVASVALGLTASLMTDIPAGPAMVAAACVLFVAAAARPMTTR